MTPDKKLQCIGDSPRRNGYADPFVGKFIDIDNQWIKSQIPGKNEVIIMIPLKHDKP